MWLVRAVEQGAFECGAVNDYVYFHWQVSWRWVVCSGIGAALCGVCAVRDEVLSFA